MKRSSARSRARARARRAAARKSVAGPHHRLNILSLVGRYALLRLLSTFLPMSMLLFPFAAGPSLHRESAAASFLADSLSPPDFFFFFCPPPLPSELAPSASRASSRPSFLLARLTKMGLAASGSRFPRKLSSYKINYPPYFIAPRAVLSRGARRRERAGSLVLFLPLPVPAARRRDGFLTNWIALRVPK